MEKRVKKFGQGPPPFRAMPERNRFFFCEVFPKRSFGRCAKSHNHTQTHEKLQYNPVKMYLTSIVIDPLPQLTSLGQLEGYIQVGRNHLQISLFAAK